MASSNSQSGNILIYILGAIFLMGLLVLALKGSSSPGSGIDEENLLIRVSEVQNYGNELERAVRYVIANGYSESDIRFAHPDAAAGYGTITDDPQRQVFSREGGGAQYREPPNGIQVTATDWIFTARNVVLGVGTSGADDSNVDLVALLMNVTEGFCNIINDKNDIVSPNKTPPQDHSNVHFSALFDGSYTRVNYIAESAGTAFVHKQEGCFEGGNIPAAGTYHYYRVLLAR